MADPDQLRTLERRIEQLERPRNFTVDTNGELYEKLAAGKPTSTGGTSTSILHYIPVPITAEAQLGGPSALALGAFSTTFTALSCALSRLTHQQKGYSR